MGVILYPAGGAVKAQQEKIYRKQGRKRKKEGKVRELTRISAKGARDEGVCNLCVLGVPPGTL
jgi:hypothetical protein